jgi:DNA-binding transcriptional MerR regulator
MVRNMAEIKFKTRSNKINYGDSFWIAFSQYCFPSEDKQGNKIKHVTNILTEKKFTIKNTDTSYRAINHWSSLGLLDDNRLGENKGWRKFSVVDLVWLKALAEFRKFGMGLDKIKVGYESLKEFDRLLEFGVFTAIMRNAMYLVIFSDGYIELANRETLSAGESLGLLQDSSYLVISINNCLKNIFPNNDLRPHLNNFQLSEKEISILSALRTGGYDEINIHKKNGDVDRIDTKTTHMGEIGKLSDILNTVTNGDFVIKKKDGKISFVEKINKEKV